MDATNIAILIGGIAQPYVQEIILRNRFTGRASLLVTAVIAMSVAAVAIWVVGGFAGILIPHFTLADPSPLLQYLWPKFTEVFTLSQLVFHGTESTNADPHTVASTTVTPAQP
jgi:hypothetical protein